MESREMRIMKGAKGWTMMAALVVGLTTVPAVAQGAVTGQAAPAAQGTAAQRQVGTVKSTSATGLTLTTAAGQDVTVAIPDAAKVLVVAPGSKDLKSATAGTLSDVTPGDKVLITLTPSGDASAPVAARVILMKAQAIAANHAAEDEAWTKGGGGIVKSVDPAAGAIVIASGLKTVTVTVTPQTIVRRYSGDSVRFADAKVSTVAEIHKGDQLRVRGTRSADGSAITADELVTGSFRNFSGLITSIDASAGTVTLKDLATKKPVTIAVGANSDVRRIPAMLAERVAARMAGGAAAGKGAAGGKGAAADAHAAPAEDGAQRERSAGMDLSQMLSRLPTETLAGLKVGDAVMIVATSPTSDTETPMAVTLLAGVDAVLRASPNGQTMTLSPWSLGGEGGGGEGGGGPEGGTQHAASPQ
jgi:ribosomal protein S17